MDMDNLNKMLKMLAAPVDADAVMGLRGLQGLFEDEGVTLAAAISYAAQNVGAFKTADSGPKASSAPERGQMNTSGMPDCRVAGEGEVEIVPPGQSEGAVISLPGASAADAAAIAFGFKDALAAAIINKSRMKLKLIDIKDKRGDITETQLQAVYDRDGMIPVKVWSNVRGEVAALAAVLRKALAASLPDIAA